MTLQAPIHVKKNFDDLRYSFRAVCTNLVTGEPVILNKGALSQAMRASSSVSFLLSPVKIDSSILVDGGLVANVPVKIAAKTGGDFVIAVNTTSSLHPKEELEFPWMVADQIVSIPMKLLNEDQIKYANVVIRPRLSGESPDDFTEVDSVVEKGYATGQALAQSIKAKIDSAYNNNLKKVIKKFFIKNTTSENNLSVTSYPSLSKLSYRDSVSNYEIIKRLGELWETGNYENIKAEVKENGNHSEINFFCFCSYISSTIKSFNTIV